MEEKTLRWNTYKEAINAQADIFANLIVGLNLLIGKTASFSIGHVKDEKSRTGEYIVTPYVYLKPEMSEELTQQYEYLYQKMSSLRSRKDDQKVNFRKASQEYKEFLDNPSLPYYVAATKLINLLTEFYKNRQVLYGVHLSLSGNAPRVLELSNLENQHKRFISQNMKHKRLKEYQNEFVEFGEFLQKKYFEEEVKL